MKEFLPLPELEKHRRKLQRQIAHWSFDALIKEGLITAEEDRDWLKMTRQLLHDIEQEIQERTGDIGEAPRL